MKIAHLGVVDGALRLGLPGRIGAGIVGKNAHNVEVVEVSKFHTRNVIKFPAKDEVKQLPR